MSKFHSILEAAEAIQLEAREISHDVGTTDADEIWFEMEETIEDYGVDLEDYGVDVYKVFDLLVRRRYTPYAIARAL